MYYPQVKYYLVHKSIGRKLLKVDPINWDIDEKELIRSTKYYGVYTQISKDLKFVKDGAKICKDIYSRFGTETEFILERHFYVGLSEDYQLDYIGNLDLKTYKETSDNGVLLQFLTGGLKSLIESQFDETVELERTTDIKGNPITPLEYENIHLTGRSIFLESLADNPANQYIATSIYGAIPYPAYNVMKLMRPLKLIKKYSSDPNFKNQFSVQDYIYDLGEYSATDFIYISDKESEITLKTHLDFSVKFISVTESTNIDLKVKIGFWKIDDNDNYNYLPDDEIILLESNNVSDNEHFSGDFSNNKIIEDGLAISIYYEIGAYSPETPEIFYLVWIEIEDPNNYFEILEDSFFEATNTRALSTFNAADRLLEIYTGVKGNFRSKFLGDQNSIFKRTAITSGTHVRNLPIQENDKNDPRAKIKTSFKEIYGLNNYFNLGWGVKNIHGVEKVVIEDKGYFFQNTVSIDLGEISNLETSCNENFLFKSMTFGNKKAGKYEELHGLQEPNAKTTYLSFLTTADKSYEVDGDIRADLIGLEYARRKQYEDTPKEDTAYDDQNWILHLDPIENILRKWQTDFISEPKINHPSSSGNLLLSPFRSMIRHSNFFNSGLTRNMNEKTRYASGTGYVDVETQVLGESHPFAENSDVVNSLMEKPFFISETLTFEKPLDFDTKKLLMGENVEGIPNIYCLISFSFRGEKYMGWLKSVKMNNPGVWELFKKY